jgi:hypothetical protein
MWLALNAKIDGNPIHKAKMASLQAMGKAGEEARKAELTRLTNLYLPKLLDARIKEIQDGIRGASGKKPAAAAGSVARVEPQSQSTIQPQSMSDTQLRTWAETEAAKDPTFKGLNTQQREEVINVLKYQKKYGG